MFPIPSIFLPSCKYCTYGTLTSGTDCFQQGVTAIDCSQKGVTSIDDLLGGVCTRRVRFLVYLFVCVCVCVCVSTIYLKKSRRISMKFCTVVAYDPRTTPVNFRHRISKVKVTVTLQIFDPMIRDRSFIFPGPYLSIGDC